MNWQIPTHRSRIGASHRRKGIVCQDYSLSLSFRTRSGVPIKLMAVADGHGGTCYWRSDVGSKLACEITVSEARIAIAKGLLSWSAPSCSSLLKWKQWLTHELPKKIVETWRVSVANDWAQYDKPVEREAEAFSPYSYGCTIGLVIMTPHWWGCTGVGDWDLVQIGRDQTFKGYSADLINEEKSTRIMGESTYSLCKTDALHYFIDRSMLEITNPDEPPFALLLSTDGVRKSCATDSDFLTLAHYLVSEAIPCGDKNNFQKIDVHLDRITTEGSGDDVSVAIGIFGPLKL